MESPLNVTSQASVPVMEREKFSNLIGVDLGVVNGWIDRGYLPTIKIGKHRLVNLALLTKECLEKEGEL